MQLCVTEFTSNVNEPISYACLWLCEYHSQTQNTVYEIISDMSSRQDAIEERLTNLEDKMQSIQVWQTIESVVFAQWFTYAHTKRTGDIYLQEHMESLPDLLSRCLTQHQERIEQRRNFLHPDTAAVAPIQAPTPQSMFNAAPMLFPHSRWVSPLFSRHSLSLSLSVSVSFFVCIYLYVYVYVYKPCPLSSSTRTHIHMYANAIKARLVPVISICFLFVVCESFVSWTGELGVSTFQNSIHPIILHTHL